MKYKVVATLVSLLTVQAASAAVIGGFWSGIATRPGGVQSEVEVGVIQGAGTAKVCTVYTSNGSPFAVSTNNLQIEGHGLFDGDGTIHMGIISSDEISIKNADDFNRTELTLQQGPYEGMLIYSDFGFAPSYSPALGFLNSEKAPSSTFQSLCQN